MGYPNPNLLPADASTFEGGTFSWIEATNCVITTNTGGTIEGTRSIRLTATAAGTISASTPYVTSGVIPGKTYVARIPVRVSTATAGKTATLRLAFYPSSGGSLATFDFPVALDPTQTGWLSTQYPVGYAVAPPTSAKVRALLIIDGCAASEVFNVDDVYLGQIGADGEPANNLLTYNEYSNEVSQADYVIDGPATIARAGFSSGVTDGAYTLRVTPSGSGLIRATLDRLIPVTPGESYLVSAVMARHNPVTGALIDSTFRSRMDWYDASGQILAADNPDQFYTHSNGDEYYFHLNSETREAPAGASYAKVAYEWAHVQGTSDAYYIDNLVFRPSGLEYKLATDSERGVVTLTLLATSVTSAAQLSIRRVDADGTMSYVRGPGAEYNHFPAAGSVVTVEDYEAPVSTSVWYYLELFDASGNLGNTLSTRSINAPVIADGDYVWLKSPGLPARNVQVMMESPLKWQRAARSSVYEIVGRRNPVHVTGTRAGRTGTMSVLVWDAASYDQFDRLLDSGLPVLIQAAPGYGIRGNLYLALGDVDSESVIDNAREEGWRWTVPVTEVDRPVGGLQGSALRTWQDVLSEYPTWGDVAKQPSWQSILTEE